MQIIFEPFAIDMGTVFIRSGDSYRSTFILQPEHEICGLPLEFMDVWSLKGLISVFSELNTKEALNQNTLRGRIITIVNAGDNMSLLKVVLHNTL